MKIGRNMKKPVKIAIACVVVLAIIISGYIYWHETLSNVAHPVQAVSVNALQVEKKQITPEADFVAKIESKDSVGLRARVTGFLQERLFKEGDLVQKDQPLFLIEKVNFEANVREAEANYARAAAQSKNAKAQYERSKTLFKTKDVSESKLDEAQAAYESAEAEVAQMKAKLDLAKKDLEYTQITAPMTGKIGESKFSVGELIGPDSGVLATLVTIDPMDAVFSVSENQLLMLQTLFKDNPDVTVTFLTANGKEYPEKGEISFVDVTLDEAMNTLKLKASFPNPENRLISGQYGRVVLKSTSAISQIVIPQRAVQRDMNNSYVYVITPQNTIEKRIIKEGTELPGFEVIIDSGLQAGESIVIDGFQKISAQSIVTPIYEPTPDQSKE